MTEGPPPLSFKIWAASTEGQGAASAPDEAGELATGALEARWPTAWLRSRSVTAEELMVVIYVLFCCLVFEVVGDMAGAVAPRIQNRFCGRPALALSVVRVFVLTF